MKLILHDEKRGHATGANRNEHVRAAHSFIHVAVRAAHSWNISMRIGGSTNNPEIPEWGED